MKGIERRFGAYNKVRGQLPLLSSVCFSTSMSDGEDGLLELPAGQGGNEYQCSD